jgi:signal transduction histidine kinase
LISNSLKFTSNGGSVNVKGKVLSQKSDLSFPEEQIFVDILENAKYGVVEIIVEDSGVGIK